MAEMGPTEIVPWKRITIRQTPDPYVADREYIAYDEVSLEPNGDLLYEELSKLGLGEPGEKFWVCFIISSLQKLSIQLDHS